MSYNFHITRAELYSDDERPITLEEIEKKFNGKLPENFSVERSGVVTIITPRGEKLQINEGAYIIYEEAGNPENHINLFFHNDGPFFCVRKNADMIPIIEFAELLGAKVQGDEGEVYIKESFIEEDKTVEIETSDKKKSLFKKLFGK